MKRSLLFLTAILAILSCRYAASQEPQQSPSLMLYYSSRCHYSQQVLNYLQEHHRTIPMKDVLTNAEAKEELIKLGGKAQVPCLLVDGSPIYNSGPIIEWLEEHPANELSSKP